MSKYGWEKGTIVIPKNQWAAFKKSLREVYAKAMQADLVHAAKAIEVVKAANKGKRGVAWFGALQTELEATIRVRGYGSYGVDTVKSKYPFKVLDTYNIATKVLVTKDNPVKPGEKKYSLGSLKAKDFPLPNSKTVEFDAEDGSIYLDDSRHSVTWDVAENNHAVERARESLMGRELFRLLGKITWVRNSGGYLTGNDEYNREDEDTGGGANLLLDTFGPLGEAEYERHTGLSRSSFKKVKLAGSIRR